MKRFFAGCLALLLLTGLFSCAPLSPASPATTDDGAPAAVLLNCFEKDCVLMGFDPVSGDRALVAYGVPVEGPDGLTLNYYLALVDGAEDALIRQIPLEGWEQQFVAVRKNGEVLVENVAEHCLLVYDAALSFDRKISLPEECYSVAYDRGSDRLYCFPGDGVELIDWDGAVTKLPLPGERAMAWAFDPASSFAVLDRPAANDDTGRKFTLYDLAGARTVRDYPYYTNTAFLFREGALYMNQTLSLSEETQDRTEQTLLTCCGEDFAPVKTLDLGETSTFSLLDGTPLAAGCRLDRSGGEVSYSPVLYDLEAEKAALVPVEESDLFDAAFCYLPDADRLLVCTISQEERGDGAGRMRLYRVDPGKLSFDEPLLPAALPEEYVPSFESGKDLAALRRAADEIEDAYPVTVLLGNACLNAAPSPDFGVISTEQDVRTDGRMEEIGVSLALLRRVLSSYPDGFLERFRNEEGEGGLRFLLVADLTSEELSNFSAAALFYRFGAWYNVVLDVDEPFSSFYFASVQHELWHAVEERIKDEYPGVFDSENWERDLLPAGFTYHRDFDRYQELSAPWNDRLLGVGNDPWFVEDYSLVTGAEDRATLLESLYNETFGVSSPAQAARAVARYPHLYAKLSYMGKQVERVFGCVYWELDEKGFYRE